MTTASNDGGRWLAPGTPVEVLTSFASWSTGFAVAKRNRNGYLLRRRSDNAVLPHEVGFQQVRPARPAGTQPSGGDSV